jgi:hypothetical protein
MNKLKHTPGKWTIGHKWNDCIDLTHKNADDDFISIYGKKEEMEANARLIIAAPEMLDCLINVYECQFDSGKTLANLNSAIRKSKKMIEKATGQKIEEVIS